jgi:hypothetical protein
MKLRKYLFAAVCFAATGARAEETGASDRFKSAAEIAPWSSKNEMERYEHILREKPEPSGIQLGKGDYVMTGPLIDGIRRKKLPPDASVGRRLLGLPIVRLFVPQPMPSPPGGGRYFRWGKSDLPWTAVAGGAVSTEADPVRHEAKTSLISVSTGDSKR